MALSCKLALDQAKRRFKRMSKACSGDRNGAEPSKPGSCTMVYMPI